MEEPIASQGKTATIEQRATAATPTAQEPPAESEYPLGAETLRRLYSNMVRYRMVAARVLKARNTTRTNEAILVGATMGLRRDDHLTVFRDGLAAEIARGEPLNVLVVRSTMPKRRKRSDNATKLKLTPAIDFSIATGIALGFQMQKKHSVVLAVSLAGGDSPDFWHEPASFAAAHKLPIVFVVKGTSPAEQGRSAGRVRDVGAQAQKFGIPGIPVDANDAVAVYRVAREAIDRARRGAGPALMECKAWKKSRAEDPIAHMQQYLQWKGLWTADWGRRVVEHVRQEISAAGRRSP